MDAKAFFICGFVSNSTSIHQKYVKGEVAGVQGVEELARGMNVE